MRTEPPRVLWLSTLDWFTGDAQESAQTFAEIFSLPQVRDDWLIQDPKHGYEAVFSRANDSVTAAPSRLEFLTVLHDVDEDLCALSPYEQVSALQSRRSQQVHATVLAVDDIDNAITWMEANGVAMKVEEACEHLPFPRVWIGWDHEGGHIPGVEPDMFLELISADGVSPKLVASVKAPSGRAGISRLGWRMFLVDELEVGRGAYEVSRCA